MHLGRTSTRRFLIWTVGSIQIGPALAPFIRTFMIARFQQATPQCWRAIMPYPLLVILGAIAGIAPIISHAMTFYLIGPGVWALIICISTRLPKKAPCPTYR
jgi:hypothetical protein